MPEDPKKDDQKKKPNSFGEWINTAQGMVVIISTLVTLIFGGGSAVLAIRHFIPTKPSSNPQGTTTNSPKPASSAPPIPSPQGLTIDQVRGALLTSSDLASIDSNLIASDVALPADSCKGLIVKPTFDLVRELGDGGNLRFQDEVTIFNSSSDAHAAFAEDAQQVTCSIIDAKVESTSNISSGLRGICDEISAWLVTVVNNSGTTVSGYEGVIRCGRAIAVLYLVTPQGSSFDHAYTFDQGIEIAVPKVQELFQP